MIQEINPQRCSLWENCLKYISFRIKGHSFNTWFRHTAGRIEEPGELIITVPNQFVADWLKSHYEDLIDEAIRENGNSIRKFGFEIAGETEEPQTEICFDSLPAAPPAACNGNGSGESLNEKYRFENFVVGNFNQFAHAAAVAVAESPGMTKFNPLFIYGGTGLGKTHLAQAIGNSVQSQHKNKKIMYASSEKFTSDFINSISNGTISKFSSRYRQVDVLLIDDVQFFSGKESTQEQFFHTFNELYHNGKQIVLTSDRHPKDTRGLEERLLSRFSSGLVADLQVPDMESKAAILRVRVEQEKVGVPEDVIYFIAENVKSNIRELEGCLTKLLAYASLEKKEITLEYAARVLEKDIDKHKKDYSIPHILKRTAAFFHIEPSVLISRKKTSQVALARQIAMYLSRRYTSHSLKSIGEAFGGRDHSTVIHACELISKKIDENPEIGARVEGIIAQL